MVLDLLLLRQAIVLVGSGAAAYTDAKTGLIFDRITYPMIAAGVVLNLIEFNWFFMAIGVAVLAIGFSVYYAGKIGGGDVKLFTGIGFMLPVFMGNPFLLNALFAACVLAVVFYSTYFVLRYTRTGIDWQENRKGIINAAVFGTLIAIYFAWALAVNVFSLSSIAGLLLPLLLALLFLAFEKGIRRKFFLRHVPLGHLEEDEVIAAEFLDEKIKKGLGLRVKGVFGEKEIEKLKGLGVAKVPVYRGMPPFGPFILLGCIAAMLQPDLLAILFM